MAGLHFKCSLKPVRFAIGGRARHSAQKMDTLRRHADRDRGIADDAPNAVPVKASKVSDEEAAEFYQRQVRWRDSVDSKR